MSTDFYLSEDERKFKEKRREVLSSLSVEWLERSEFWSEFDERYRKFDRYLDKEMDYPMAMEEIRARVDQPPVYTPLEADHPGPCERWYGKINGNLLILTFYYHTQYPKLTALTIEDNQSVEEEVLKELTKWRNVCIY